MKFIQKISEEIFQKKYMLHREKDAEEVFRKIAQEIALAEETGKQKEWEEKFFQEISTGRLIPAGRILANARPESKLKNYNNCFTIDIEDSMESIYQALREDALISKMGGGVGFDISKLRPKGDKLSRGGESSGVISFLKIFDQSAKTIMTGGQRRSAHIALLDISHPEIEDFIRIKQGDINNQLTQFNISVKITDAFIQAVREDKDWNLVFQNKIYKTVKARYLYNLLAKNAFLHNEPGIFNADIVERFNNGYWAFKMDRVNPCGELVMPPYSLCCLSAVNLTAFVENPFTDQAVFHYSHFQKTIAVGIRFLDNILDQTAYPLEKIRTFSRQWRRIGLGFTGLGNVFAMLKLKYGHPDSLEIAEKIAKTLRDTSYIVSSELAGEKGSFPAFDADKYLQANFIQTLPQDIQASIRHQGIRNVQLNTVAPTGTTSLSVGQNCSSGIEPIFSLEFKRNIRTGQADEVKTELVYDYAWHLYQKQNGKTVPDYFVTAEQIDPYHSIDLQAMVQKYIDHSISKTLNLPDNTSLEEYKTLFLYAYEKGLKGFTTFNPQGSMKGVLEYQEESIRRAYAPPRPRDLPCHIHRTSIPDYSCIVILGFLKSSVYELFVINDLDQQIDLNNQSKGIVRKVKKGRYDLILTNGEEKIKLTDFTNNYNSSDAALARFISMALRHGTPIQFVVDQLTKDSNFISFERIVSRILKQYIKDGEEVITGERKCPECRGQLIYRDGCITCRECGYSKCS
ncbi:MAG: adenosylcobalamin-dependent ribonucleoside-diphosphate reductase [Spirochaetes bacterium]|nr:adenosylcobalamin-dependent ribonucleoside-diphosphate reductase [Spirochaetota bacterium]